MHLLGLFDQLHALLMAHKIKVAKSFVFADIEEQGGLLLVAIEKFGQADPCQVDDGKAIWEWFWIELRTQVYFHCFRSHLESLE